jgi:hypothetical protein
MATVNISNPAVYKRTRKKVYEIWLGMPRLGTKVSNKLEDAHYTTDAKQRFVLSGLVGEQWVIDAVKLAKTYTFADGTPITQETCGAKADKQSGIIDWVKVKTIQNGQVNWVVRVPKSTQLSLPTSWGDVLKVNRAGIDHNAGDFVVCADAGGVPNIADRWVVNGVIFPETYDCRAWSGEISRSKIASGGAPKPRSLLS